MDTFSTDLTPAEPLDRSTQLDEGRPTEASPAKEPAEEKAKPESRLDAIKRAAGEQEEAKPEAKPEPKAEEKPAEEKTETVEKPKEEGQAAQPEKKPEQADQRPRRQPIEAPANFMPRAKELWQNTPHEVRADMQRVISEAEAKVAQATESTREYEAIRPYAEMARQSGTTIDQALQRYVGMEQTLRSDPAAGFRNLLANMQISPTQAVGHIMAAFNVRPEQLAQHMMERPNEYTALAQSQRQHAQPQEDPRVNQLERQLSQLQAQQASSEVERTIIAPFVAEHPRYYELEGTIAHFLQSDIVPKTLSPHDRLAAAYDMAVRISPSVKQPSAAVVSEDSGEKAESRAGDDFGGNKSVRGAPATGVDTSNPRRSKMSRGEALKAAAAAAGLAL